MDEKSEPAEFPEWEFLHNSDDPLDFSPHLDSPLIKPDYFSLHHPNSPDSVSNPNSSCNSETGASEVDRNFDDSYVANQLFPAGEKSFVIKESSSSSLSSSTLSNPEKESDSDGDMKMMTMVVDETTVRSTTTTSEFLLDDVTAAGGFNDSKEEEVERAMSVEEEKKKEEDRRVVWWKVPFEVLKYWVVRVSPVPVWSLSVAATAAFLGLVILGRRLYKMKRKTQTLKLNVALDDKKVSQLMGRVARLNEAFSVVKRVPIVRPSLPASSVIMRPVMSMG